MYLSNVIIFILMLYLSLVYPSLLNNHYWDYLLIGFFTSIVFHTGHEVGKSWWYIILYVLLWLYISFLDGYIFLLFMLIVLSMNFTLNLFYFLFGFSMRILFIFMNIITFTIFYLLTLSQFQFLFLFFIRFHLVIIFILPLLILSFIYLSVFISILKCFVRKS